jgi:hypothetical protein
MGEIPPVSHIIVLRQSPDTALGVHRAVHSLSDWYSFVFKCSGYVHGFKPFNSFASYENLHDFLWLGGCPSVSCAVLLSPQCDVQIPFFFLNIRR